MTLQQLHYFIMTSKLHSFTKAAEECNISQPALSHAIGELEAELGCRLFLRIGRSIRLTDQGERCLVKANEIEKSALELTKIAKEKELPHDVRIGYTVLGHLNAYFAAQAQCVSKEYLTAHQIITAYDEITEIKQHLLERRYDFIILPGNNCSGIPHPESVQLTPDRLNLIVSKKNPLFHQSAVDVAALAQEGFIFYPNNDELNAAYTRLCEKNGFTPRVVGYGRKMGDIINEVIQKNAVAFCSATFEYLKSDDIRVIEVGGELNKFHLELVKLRDNQNPAAEELLRMLKRKRLFPHNP